MFGTNSIIGGSPFLSKIQGAFSQPQTPQQHAPMPAPQPPMQQPEQPQGGDDGVMSLIKNLFGGQQGQQGGDSMLPKILAMLGG